MTFVFFLAAFASFVIGILLLRQPKWRMTRWHGASFLVAGMVVGFGIAGFLSVERERDAWRAHQATETRKCRADLACWADQHFIAASSRCAENIERLARYEFEWTDGAQEPKFSRWRWKDKKAGVVTYIGERIRLQGQSGGWRPHVYACDYDPAGDRVLMAQVAALGQTVTSAKCRAFLACWAEKFIVTAWERCKPEIVQLAPYKWRWLPKLPRGETAIKESGSSNGLLDQALREIDSLKQASREIQESRRAAVRFSSYRWKDMDKGVVTFMGDEIDFMNESGRWQPQTYTCDYDTLGDRMLAVNAAPGRLPR